MTATLPMQGMRVLEIAQGVAGPMAASRLADLGAEVVKLEFGEGDWMRRCPPALPDGTSSVFNALNRGKRGMRLEADDAATPATVKALAARADVLVTDADDATLDRLGLQGVDEAVCPWHTRLVVARISPWGHDGPMAGQPGGELQAQAMAGYTRYLGQHGQPSLRLGADVAGCATAIFTVQAVLAAVFERSRSGQGQRVDLSLLNSLLSMKTVHLAAQSDPDTFEGPRVGGAYDPPERGWATADKPITFAFGGAVGEQGRAGWTDFVREMGLDHMLDDPRFDKNGRLTTGLGPLARAVKPAYEAAFVHHPASHVVAKVREHGGFASAYLDHAELLQEPQLEAVGAVRTVATREGRPLQALDYPARFSDLAIEIRGAPPALGEHSAELLAMLAKETAR